MLTTPDPDRRLRCDRCGHSMDVTADELLLYTRGDWPRCCMVAMILEVDDQSVSPSDVTELERPSRTARKMFPS
jgi:hypothetical protein